MALSLNFNFGRGLSRIVNLLNVLNNEGGRAYGVLRVAANVVNGEHVVIGGETFIVDIINTDSATNLSGAMANTTADTVINTDVAPSPNWVVGDLIRVESEICRVKAVHSSTKYTVQRATCNTSAAGHADTTDIYESDAPGVDVGAGKIPVGLVTTLTPAAFSPALAAAINADWGASNKSASVRAVSLDSGAQVLIVADGRRASALTTTETLAGGGNAFDAATLTGGSDPVRRRFAAIAHTCSAAEVALGAGTAGWFYVPLDFTPNVVTVQIRSSAGAAKAFDGSVTITAASGATPAYIKVTNSGTTDFIDGDIAHIAAFEA